MQGEDDEPNIVQFHDFANDQIRSRIDAAGTIITSVQSEPEDTNLAVGELAFWYDISNDLVKFKARKNATDYYSGQVTLTIIP